MATESSLKKKRDYFDKQRMTSHWPHKIKVFSKNPRTYGNTLPSITSLPPPTLKRTGLFLAGFTPPPYKLDEEGYVIVI